jgi:carboxyl-terminal processing protease
VKKVSSAMLAIVTVNVIYQFLGGSAVCAALKDAVKLYNDGQFSQAKAVFEQELGSTMGSPDTAYYYALTLNSMRRTQDAVKICKTILKRYPKSNAAKMSKLAIVRWSVKSDVDIGLVGLKYAVHPGQEATIVTVFQGTPASNARLQEGDCIMRVDGVSTKNLDKDRLYQLIGGQPDTKVRLTIRKGDATSEKSLVRMHSADFARAYPDIWRLYLSSM